MLIVRISLFSVWVATLMKQTFGRSYPALYQSILVYIVHFKHDYCNSLSMFCSNLLLLCQYFALCLCLPIIPIICRQNECIPNFEFNWLRLGLEFCRIIIEDVVLVSSQQWKHPKHISHAVEIYTDYRHYNQCVKHVIYSHVHT